jgi:hypothetical protein
MYQGVSTIMRSVFDWKHSRMSMLEVEAVPQLWGMILTEDLDMRRVVAKFVPKLHLSEQQQLRLEVV